MATRWACIGPGRIASDFFTAIRDNLSDSDHELVAVASRNLARAESFAERFKFKRAYSSYDDVANDEEVEVVYIATLPGNHKDLSIQMLRAGKHVVCEIPMAMTLKEAKRVLEAARESKKLFVEGYWSRFMPGFGKIREELAKGALGDIRMVHAYLGEPIMDWQPECDPANGSGSLQTLGGCNLDLATMVFNEMPESIQAQACLADPNGKGSVDLGTSILLKYKSEATALLHSEITGTGPNTAMIVGRRGFIEIPAVFYGSEKVTTPSGTYMFPLKKGDYVYLNTAGLQYEATAVREAILQGKTEIEVCSWHHSEIIMAIKDEVHRQIGIKYDFD